ncbi:protein NUCLEAR FUSION DEFECTIVE 4-like [Tripterygium wilfordii]|uniref:Protein NUCLEAR FUSION DEFECTIVE 4-like n=1 Tax=Tripterygium wilfordii TaxID=458696 RepID=A0A7J7CKY1_TRIWF|nr:protein NUCLEAR FUSION DEFECTIVE 4-like [Tripterygium wilfordii]XP_038726272.1 protein NUCLEAR FUSION DEFECTIVE 4-like [Tripterygium wilfordii]KAF5734722.1 protein NUCLEAR FUSION DEFECTIVE 4-like [Tripterygium wilfordii]
MERLKRELNTKWFSTVASIWIQCTSGSLYTFSVYSQTLKSTQHYDQSTLDAVSVFKDIGANFGVLSGFLYDSVGGPRLVLLAGAIQCFAGYFLMWASVTGLLPPPPVPLMCFFMLLAAHAMTFFNTANVVTSVRNFRNYSGTAVGIMKGFLGLSGAILIQVYQTLFNNKPTTYLLMLSFLPTTNTLLLLWFVRIYEISEGNDKKHLNGFSFIAVAVATYLMVIIFLEHAVSLESAARVISLFVLVILLASPLLIALKGQHMDSNMISDMEQLLHGPVRQKAENRHSSQDSNSSHLLAGNSERDNDIYDKNSLALQEELNLLQAIQTLDFWILFLAMACGMGSGLATVNNISQIGVSLGYTSFETNTLVSLWSIWNFLGRFGAGYLSDYVMHVREWARPLFMVITLAAMSIGHLMIASGLRGALYAGSIFVGVCYGSQWSLMPSITSEIFSIRHMGTIFNTITIAGPVGSYIFSVRVVGYIYDKEASGEGNTCIGTHCFMLSFIIMASATLLGSLAALVLFFRTRRFYSQVVLRKLRSAGV